MSLTEERFQTEDALQALLADHPELLDGEQVRPGDPRRWVLITREQGIADTPDAPQRWSLDHLILDQDAVPTLVEVKRGANSELRRQVVGQMLDYAANAARTWTADELRSTFEEATAERGSDPDEALARLLDTEEPDADGYWEDVATNLAARRLRLLFVADAIPDELARIVEFLNEQMPNIEVLAVEIKQFRDDKSAQTLVPRVIGRVAGARGGSGGASGSRRKLNREEFLAELGDDAARSVADRILSWAEECGAELNWGASSVAVCVSCAAWTHTSPLRIAWLFLPGRKGPVPRGGKNVTFGMTALDGLDSSTEDLRDTLNEWVEEFRADEFAEFLDMPYGKAWTMTYEDAAAHIPTLTERLRGIITRLRSIERPES